MIRRRTAGFLGIAAAVICWSALWVFGALRPSYSHTANAVSELGALGFPLALPWNLMGFIAPGILLAIMSLIHGIAWLIAALLLVRPMLRRPDWRSVTYVNVALVLATLVASFALRGRLSDALVQRIAGAIYFAWFVVMSVRLIRIDRKQFQVTGG
jgi:hypothetical membrane protein